VPAGRGPNAEDRIAIHVVDDGPGIPSDKREEIFGEFTRLPADEGKPGSGLGLSIARRIARLLGGAHRRSTLCAACSSRALAIAQGLAWLRSGEVDCVLAGGADGLCRLTYAGFGALAALSPEPCRPFDARRNGLNLGEGAAFLVLEAEAHARARGARIRAFLDGYGVAADAVHMTGPDRQGRGAARAMQAALRDGGRSAGDIGYVSAHGTATPFNDLMEGKAFALVFGAAPPPTNSIKSALGHTLGAAAALEAIACVRTLETGLVPPTPGLETMDPEIPLDVVRGQAREVRPRVVLSTASGFGGTNAAVVLSAP